ncbi:uncharacterized [Tachysurus ichikawai]
MIPALRLNLILFMKDMEALGLQHQERSRREQAELGDLIRLAVTHLCGMVRAAGTFSPYGQRLGRHIFSCWSGDRDQHSTGHGLQLPHTQSTAIRCPQHKKRG